MSVNFQTASDLICHHARAQEGNSFAAFILACQLQGTGSLGQLNEIRDQLIAALETINEHTRLTNHQLSSELNEAVIEILVSGWDRYRWWQQNQHLSKEPLDKFAELLSDFGFAWARLLDKTTPSLKTALNERRGIGS